MNSARVYNIEKLIVITETNQRISFQNSFSQWAALKDEYTTQNISYVT